MDRPLVRGIIGGALTFIVLKMLPDLYVPEPIVSNTMDIGFATISYIPEQVSFIDYKIGFPVLVGVLFLIITPPWI
jgi:hypothetical protein